MKPTTSIKFATGSSVQVFEVDGKQEIFLRKRCFLLGVCFFHISREAFPDIEATARAVFQPASPTTLEYTYALGSALLLSFQVIVILLFFTARIAFPMWYSGSLLLVGLAVSLIFLRLGFLALMRNKMCEPFSITMSRGVVPRALRDTVMVGETGFFPRSRFQPWNATAYTYVSASRRGLRVSRLDSLTRDRFGSAHTWIARSDLDSFLRTLSKALDAVGSVPGGL